LRDIYGPGYLRKIVVHEAYIPYRFVDGVTENACIPMPECDDGGGEMEGYADWRAECANYDGEITKRDTHTTQTEQMDHARLYVIIDYLAKKIKAPNLLKSGTKIFTHF